MAEVLIAIWEITGINDADRLATHKTIEEFLKQRKKNSVRVSAVLTYLSSLPNQQCIESFKVFQTDKKKGTAKQGQPPIAYCFHAEMVTLPQTASILLELMDFKPSQTYLIYKDEFVKYISEKYGWPRDFIENRIDAASQAGYVVTSKISAERDSLWGSVRIQREWEYLLLLSEKQKSAGGSTEKNG